MLSALEEAYGEYQFRLDNGSNGKQGINVAVLHNLFLNSVVSIAEQKKESLYRRVATGFIYGHNVDVDLYQVFIVTNAHVFEAFGNGEKIYLFFNEGPGEEQSHFYIDLFDANGNKSWVRHPDTEVDIGVISVSALPVESNPNVECIFDDKHVAPVNKLIDMGISEGDAVFTLGFPLGLSYASQNAVLVRHGVIARIKEALEKKTKFYLLDSLSYPGSSGSPVISKPDAIAIEGTEPQRISQLIGILCGHIPYEQDVINPATGKVGIVETNPGIAVVHPCDFIEETIQAYRNTNYNES